MTEPSTAFELRNSLGAGPAPVLTHVQAQGRLDSVLFELTLRQSYRNTGPDVLEVIYTFPLPPQAVLLGFASELNGRRLAGQIVPRKAAEQRYEQALAEGDAPVLLEARPDGLHTANIGNLKPGDELVLECRYAQLLAFEQGRLRLSLPTTIAPRYGLPLQAGLQPQQVPVASPTAAYPLTFSLHIGGELAAATLACPTHETRLHRSPDGSAHLELAPGAWLDRDVVITVTPQEPRPCLLVHGTNPGDDSAPVVAMAAWAVPTGPLRDRIALKLLVDCSGSMNGDSIESARAALRGVLAGLTPDDQISLSLFGDAVVHAMPAALARPQAQRHLAQLIDAVRADLGGTEMERALSAVLALPLAEAADLPSPDVLMITDGQIWQHEAMVAAARQSGHRVFAIGVGTAPAQGVLQSLAEATGGAIEFATPGEQLEAAARRMLHRVRQPARPPLQLDWGVEPVWQTRLIGSGFGGDTLLAFAGLREPVPARGVQLRSGADRQTATVLARGEAEAPCAGDALARMAAARRLSGAEPAQALALALHHQLMSDQTLCVLVHRREDADRPLLPATLHRIEGMLAAGWGGTSRVVQPGGRSEHRHTIRAMMRPEPVLRDRALAPEPMDVQSVKPSVRRLADLARHMAGELLRAGGPGRVRAPLLDLADDVAREVQLALQEATALGLGPEAWVLLAYWLNEHAGPQRDTALSARFQHGLSGIDAARQALAFQIFEHRLGHLPVEA